MSHRPRIRALCSGFVAATPLALVAFAACIELPETPPTVFESNATGGAPDDDDDDAEAGAGDAPGDGGAATTAGASTGAMGGTSAGSTTGTGGVGAKGGSATSGGAGAGNDAGGASGNGATGGTGGADSSGGVAGNANGGSSAGNGGSGAAGGGAAGSGGRTYPTDRGDFFGDSRCTPDIDLCDDFENTTLDQNRWRVQGPAPTIDSTRAARGLRSAHFHTVDNGLSILHTTAIFPAPSNTYWGRLFVWFDSMPTAPMWAHWSIAAAVGSGTAAEVRVGGQFDGTSNRFGVGTDKGPTGDWTLLDEDPGDPVPVASWVCVEWQHRGDTDETRFFWDGVEHTSLRTSASLHGGPSGQYLLPEFESVWIGWWHYQSGTTPPEFDVWIDEVALDAERIGCGL